jgi:archaea-specific DNA-binding protein
MTEEKKVMEPAKKEHLSKNEGIVFIGDKPFMNYVTSVVMQLQQRKQLVIRARGKFISRAVDVSQMAIHRFVEGAKIGTIKIASEEFENKEKRKVNVSTIEIEVIKK